MSKSVLVPIADGIEEIETVCIVDVLRRAGASVVIASVDKAEVRASRGVRIIADKLISQCIGQAYDLIVLPGGMPGAERLRDSQELAEMLKRQVRQGRLYGAICASPAVVLGHHGLLSQKKATCHPALADKLKCGQMLESKVVVDGNCVTSRGPATAIDFALKLVEVLYGSEKAKEVGEPMLV